MIVRRLIVAAAACAVSLTVVACSSSTPPAGNAPAEKAAASAPASTPEAAATPATAPHACDLLKVQDAEAVFGPGAKLTRDSVDTCDLQAPTLLGPSISVKIEPVSDTWDGGDTMLSFDKTGQKIPGLGDGGYSYMGGSIVFKKGPWEVSVISTAYKGDKSKLEAARMVAERVAAAM